MDVWILVWVISTSQGATSGAAYLGSAGACDQARAVIEAAERLFTKVTVACIHDTAAQEF